MTEQILNPGAIDLFADSFMRWVFGIGATALVAGILALIKMSAKVSRLIEVVDVTLPGIRAELHEVTTDAKAWRERTDQTLLGVQKILERHDVKLENLQRELDRGAGHHRA